MGLLGNIKKLTPTVLAQLVVLIRLHCRWKSIWFGTDRCSMFHFTSLSVISWHAHNITEDTTRQHPAFVANGDSSLKEIHMNDVWSFIANVKSNEIVCVRELFGEVHLDAYYQTWRECDFKISFLRPHEKAAFRVVYFGNNVVCQLLYDPLNGLMVDVH